jgi:hypothetical protein
MTGLVAISQRKLRARANEVALRGNGMNPAHVVIFERSNAVAAAIERGAIYRMVPAPPDAALTVVTKERERYLLPDWAALNGYTAEKVEGFAIDAAGTGWAITDNDGVADNSGGMLFGTFGTVK